MSTYATSLTPKYTADFRYQIKHSLDKELRSKCEKKNEEDEEKRTTKDACSAGGHAAQINLWFGGFRTGQ